MEPAHSVKPTSTAPSPFDTAARSDLIVRTADDVSFFVLKAFLIYASPFFSNHLANSTEDEARDGLPVHRAPEDSRTMTAILRLCYPGVVPASYLVSEIVETPVVSALRKYGMHNAEARFKNTLLEAEMVEKDPIGVYAISRHLEWDDLARMAARETLSIPLMQYRELPLALALATALDYQLLLNYFVDCGDAAYNLLDVDSALSAKGAITDVFAAKTIKDSVTVARCSTCSQILTFCVEAGGERRWVHSWLPEFLKACRQKIRDCPGRVVLCKEIVDEAIVVAARQCTSRSCSPAEVRRCIEFVNAEVQLAISEVNF